MTLVELRWPFKSLVAGMEDTMLLQQIEINVIASSMDYHQAWIDTGLLSSPLRVADYLATSTINIYIPVRR